MPREKTEFETWLDRFPPGTIARIKAVLRKGEVRADFVREAVANELTKREKRGPKK